MNRKITNLLTTIIVKKLTFLYDGDIANNQNIASISFHVDQSTFLT